MTDTHRVSALVLASVCLAFAAPARADDVRDAVEAGNRAFVAAFLRGDATAVASLYTREAQVVAPGSPAASGRPAIAAFWQKSIDSGVKGITLETAEVESAGDLAFESGTVRLVAQDGTTNEARYIVVWRRIDGTWMLHRDIWNSSK
jgi:uncharacterized protein (TIGR02246 family)